MIRIVRPWPTGLLLCLTAFFAACDQAPPESGENTDAAAAAPGSAPYEPFAGRAQEEGTFSGYTRTAHYVPMPDGVELAVTIYLPAHGPDVSGFPVLLWYMPGHRESINPETGEITSAYPDEDLDFFTSHGYALAAAEMRGSGASFGVRELDRGPQIGKDGKALVEWLAAREWSNGAVGMVGRSYQGFTQYATAAERPAALKAIFPEIAGFDDYTSMFYPGGIFVRSLSEFATDSIRRDDLNYFEPEGRRPRLPSVPVIDEDGDGELADEIPIDKDGDGTFLNDGEPTYRDGEERKHIYYNATKAHLGNASLSVEKLEAAPYRNSKIGDTAYTYADLDPGDKPLRLAEAGIAAYHVGGWFDYHARDTVMWQATLSGHAPSRLIMSPTAHGGFPATDSDVDYSAGPYFSHFGDSATRLSLNREKLRFFDHYVRGIDNGFDREPPVLLFVMGEGWRAEQEWPLARERRSRYYFGSDGTLDTSSAEPGIEEYPLDMNADSRTDGANRWNYRLASSRSIMIAAADNGRRASFTTTELIEPVEVTGHPVITLTLGANLPAGDVFVYLEDVGPDGVATVVTEGQLRANFLGRHPIQEMVTYDGAEPAVKPALPWHRYHAEDVVDEPFADGRIAELVLDLMPTSWVFKRGHRVRVSITGADQPSFALHPDYEDAVDPTYYIHTGDVSFVELPVITD
jgi:uncharacterized protein